MKQVDIPPNDSSTAQTAEVGSRRRCRVWWLAMIVIFAAVAVDGSRAVPADPNKPIQMVGTSAPAQTDVSALRVATFNIHSGKGRDRKTDLMRTSQVIKSPMDVIGLNEVRVTWGEPFGLNQVDQLGQHWGMQSAFIPTERRWWHDHFGNALLTRVPLQQIQKIPLAGTRGKAFRCAALTQFEFKGQTVLLLTVHVDSQSDRELQLRAVLSLFLGLQPPAILMGDLNTPEDDQQLQALLARADVVDAHPEARVDKRGKPRIDWILARGLKCRAGEVLENDASDHPALTAEFELAEKSVVE